MLLCVKYAVAHMLHVAFKENKKSVIFSWNGGDGHVQRTYFDKNSIRYESKPTLNKYT